MSALALRRLQPSQEPVMDDLPRRRPLLRPGWPLTASLAGFAIWWVLGISNFIGHIAAVVMLLELVRMRRIRLPRTFGVWLLFLLWVAAGVLVLQVAAPYAVPSTSPGRYVTFAYRLGWYLSGTVALIYIGNMRDVVSSLRISRAAAAMFLTIVAGGWLGVLVPHTSFPSVLELILPAPLASNEFVNFLVHPQVVQDYARAVAEYPRPSAPFGYANIWGLNFACFLPFFLHAWFGQGAGWRRVPAPFVLLLALVPAVLSLNRGMWLAVATMAAVVGARSAMRGHFRSVVALAAGVLITLVLVVLTPLGALVQDRLANPQSAQTRSNVAETTISSVLEGSPVVGFGTTRDPANAFYSVAGGDSPNCPECAPPALGTQGHLWLVLYSQGVVGLLLFLWFHGAWLVRGLRLSSGIATAASCLLIAQFVTLLIYDSLGLATFGALMAIGLIWREWDRERTGYAQTADSVAAGTLQDDLRLYRESKSLIAVLGLTGLMAGGGLSLYSGPDHVATVSVYLPEEPLGIDPRTVNLDALAYIARGGKVTSALQRAVGKSTRFEDVVISADPNSRILNLSYSHARADKAFLGAGAAGDALLEARRELIQAERREAVRQFDAQYLATRQAIETIDRGIATVGMISESNKVSVQIELLESLRADLLIRVGRLAGQEARASTAKVDPGRVVRPTAVGTNYDRWVVFMSSGVLLGLLVGIALAGVRSATGSRIGSITDLGAAENMPLLAHLPSGVISISGRLSADGALLWKAAVDGALEGAPVTVVLASSDPSSRRVAVALEDALESDLRRRHVAVSHGFAREDRIVVIANSKMRLGALRRFVAGQRKASLTVIGLVLVDGGRWKSMFVVPAWLRRASTPQKGPDHGHLSQ